MNKELITKIFEEESAKKITNEKGGKFTFIINTNDIEIRSIDENKIQTNAARIVEELGYATNLKKPAKENKKEYILFAKLKLNSVFFLEVMSGQSQSVSIAKSITIRIENQNKIKPFSIFELIKIGFVGFDMSLQFPFLDSSSEDCIVLIIEKR